jgi:hypothetical protein
LAWRDCHPIVRLTLQMSQQHTDRIHEIIVKMGAEVRKELDDAKKYMSDDQYKNFHEHTVEDLLRRVKKLLAYGEAAEG